MSKNNIVFIVRKFNDMDNTLPLIDKCILEGHHVRIISLRAEVLNDFLVKYLNKKYKIFIEYPVIHKNGLKVGILYILSKILRYVMNKYEIKFSMKYVRYAISKIDKLITSIADLNKNINRRVFNGMQPDVVIFDKTNIIQHKVYRRVTNYLSVSNIPMIRLDHGMDVLVYNSSCAEASKAHQDLIKNHNYNNIYDFSICRDPLDKTNYSNDILLGSLR